MGQKIDDIALDSLFREARTHTKWRSRPVTDQTLRDLYDLLKWAPTSANSAPARFAFLRSKEAKEGFVRRSPRPTSRRRWPLP